MAKKKAAKKVARKPAAKRARKVRKTKAPVEAVNVEVLPRNEEGFLDLVVSGTKFVGEKLWEHREVIIGAVAAVIGDLIAKKTTSPSRRPRLR